MIKKKILLLSLLALGTTVPSTQARVTLAELTDPDVMYIVRDVEVDDLSPYKEEYDRQIRLMEDNLKKMQRIEKTLSAYVPEYLLEGFRPNPDPSVGEKRNKVTTPEQREYLTELAAMLRKKGKDKDANDIEKKMAKGELSKKAKSYINKEYMWSSTNQARQKDIIDKVRAICEKDGVKKCMATLYPEIEINPKKLIIKDTVVNGNWRPTLSRGYSADRDRVRQGWEWTKSDDNYDYRTEQYPVWVEYKYYSAHPEYRVLNNGGNFSEVLVYDKKGNLVGVPEINPSELYLEYDDENLKKAVLQYAYNANYKGIQDESAHTQHYIQVQTGMASLTAKEKKAQERASAGIANALLNSMKADARYGKKSRKAKAAGRKSAAQFFSALAGSKSDFYDNLGYNWIQDATMAYENVLRLPYKIERLSPTSFRMTYIKSNGQGRFEIIADFTSGSQPYQAAVKYSLNPLSDKTFFTPEEEDFYEDLHSRIPKGQ